MITIQEKGLTLSESDKEKIIKKAEKLSSLGADMQDESTKIEITFELETKDKDLIKGKIHVSLPKDTLHAEASAKKNVVSIMDMLEDELRPQIEKHNRKKKEGIHHHG